MSKKSALRNMFSLNKKSTTPRSLDEIRKEYGEVSGKAANARYLMFIQEQELNQYLKRMQEINNEASERMKLEAEEAKRQANLKKEASNESKG